MFRGGSKIRVSDSVLRKVRHAAEFLGCTVEDFIETTLQREAERTISITARRETVGHDHDQPEQELEGLGQ
jgi:uncharacterized protein (DUF1778 family)